MDSGPLRRVGTVPDMSYSFAEQRARDKAFLQKKQKEGVPSMRKMYYAGIGSRKTPDDILVLMEQLGNKLREDCMILRSGHAPGADQAFERGAGGAAQIFLPWATFEQDVPFSASRDPETSVVVHPTIFNSPQSVAFDVAAQVHPAWANLSHGAQNLHARNVHQILGPDLSRAMPVEFVICWTPEGIVQGGTATAIRLAEKHRIKVYNLADEDHYDMAFEWAWS